MKKLLLLILLTPPAFAVNVFVENSTLTPVNITGTVTFASPAITTVSWQNQGAQPVTSTFTIITSSYPVQFTQTNNPATYTVTPGSGTQPVSITSTTVSWTSQGAQPVTMSSGIVTSVSNPVTVTPGSGTVSMNWTGSGAQPITSTSAVVTSTYSINMNQTNNPATYTVTMGSGSLTDSWTSVGAQPVTSTSTVITSTYSINVLDTPPILTKGTQGATGFSTQDLKDAGRTFIIFVATGVAGVTTEALFSFQLAKSGSIIQSTNTYAVTAGKTLRLQGIYCSNRDASATSASFTRAVIRWNPTGAATASSPILWGSECGGLAAAVGVSCYMGAPFPDGIEIPSTSGSSIGVSHLDQATTNLVSCTLVGYEY